MRHPLVVAFLAVAACGLGDAPESRVTAALDETEIRQVRLAIFGVPDELEPIPPNDPKAAELSALLRERVDQFGRREGLSRDSEQILRDRVHQMGRPQPPQ
jgi:hypothetical protein